MALQNYKIDEPIKVVYQAAGAKTGIVVQMDVYDETGAKDVAQSGVMTEIGVTGRYQRSFIPDANGEWSVQIADAAGGKSVASHSVGNYNIHQVGAIATTIDGKVDTIDGVVDAVASDLSTLDGKVVTLDGKVDALEGKIDIIDEKLASIQAPPMIG